MKSNNSIQSFARPLVAALALAGLAGLGLAGCDSAKGKAAERNRARRLLIGEITQLPKFFTAEAVATDPRVGEQARVKRALEVVLMQLDSPMRARAMLAQQAIKRKARGVLEPLNRRLA